MTDLAANLAALAPHLDRFRKTGVLNRIGGQDCEAAFGATFENTSPVDESVICSVAKGGAADIDAAARAATQTIKMPVFIT